MQLIIDAITFPSWLSEDIFSIGPLTIRWYGMSYVIGTFGAYLYARNIIGNKQYWTPKKALKASIKSELVPNNDNLWDLVFYSFIGVVVGARLGYLILYSPETYLQPGKILEVWRGGMSFHGGLIGVCLAIGFVSWRNKISYMRLADIACIGAPIGLASGRLLGNFINQELYGHPTDLPWGMIFPKASDGLPRHPTQLYEAFLEGLILWLILRILTTKYKGLAKPGLITGAFIFFYGIFRFSVEFVREPDNITQFGHLTRGMAYSLPMILAGLFFLLWAQRRQPVSPKYALHKASQTKIDV